VSAEALLLALSTVIRPTSAAAVVAMLATPRPQRLLAAYVLAGMAWSLAVGTLVVVVLAGISNATESSAERPVLDTVLGGAALGYAAAAWIGVLPRRRADGAPSRAARMRRRLQNLSPSGAALAGVLTHLPGLVYLAALNAIVSSATGTLDSLVQVVIYNAIWFSVATTALVVSVYRPRVSRDLLERITGWVREHQRVLIVVFCGVLGTYLVASGVVGLLGTSA
jgi:hypothetical protein